MINALLIYPVIACIAAFFIKNKIADIIILNSYALLHFIITLILLFGEYSAQKNKYFAIDDTNAIFLLVLSFIFLMVSIYNTGYIKNKETEKNRISRFVCMILIFVFSMTGTVLSTNLGLSWILIEATTLSSAYLIYFNKTKNSIEAAWKYVFICSIGIALAFVGIIFLNISQNELNTLDFNKLYEYASTFDANWLKMAFVFMLFGFGAKMGLAPAHFWLPDAHSEAPAPISALLSAALLNSAFLVIIRIYKITELANCVEYPRTLLFIMGFLSLFVTAVFVFHIKNYKRMLAYSSIENMGILVIALAIGKYAYLAVILHLIGHSLSKASFFLTSGNILSLFNTKRIKSTAGIIQADKMTGILWTGSFLAICAFPVSILFISEFLIIKALLIEKHYILCALFLILLTIILYGISRAVVKTAFGNVSEDKKETIEKNKIKLNPLFYLPQIIMLAVVFVMGIYIPDSLNRIIELASNSL